MTPARPTVSVVVPVLDDAEHLRVCLALLAAQVAASVAPPATAAFGRFTYRAIDRLPSAASTSAPSATAAKPGSSAKE